MSQRSRIATAVFLFSLSLLAASCGEMTPAESNQLLAGEHFKAGMKAFDQKDYESAHSELMASLALDGSDARAANALGWVDAALAERSRRSSADEAAGEEGDEEGEEGEADVPLEDIAPALMRFMAALEEAQDGGEIGPLVTACDDLLALLDADSPERLPFEVLRAAGLLELENFSEAAQAVSGLLEKMPDNVEVLRVASSAYYYSGDVELSDLATERLYQLAPDDPVAQNNLAYSLAEQGRDLDTAYRLAAQALASNPDNPAMLDTMGWVYYRSGDYKQARAYVEAALQGPLHNAEREVVLSHYREILVRMGN